MSKFLLILLSIFICFSTFAATQFHYPISYTPEDLHHVNFYGSEEGIGGGGEFALYGAQNLEFFKQKMSLKIPDIHVGFTVNKKRETSFYIVPQGKLFSSIGLGTGTKAFIRYNGSSGFGVTTMAFAFYTLPRVFSDLDILTVYAGFKSKESNFSDQEVDKILQDAYTLYGSDQPIYSGFYYSWSVLQNYAVSVETDFKAVSVLFHFGGGALF